MKIGRRVIPNALIFFLALTVAGGGYIAIQAEKEPAPDSQTTETQSGPDETNEASSPNASQQEANTGQPAPEPARSALTPSITTLDQDSSNVYLSVLVNGTTGGTCAATFQKAGYNSVTQTAPVGRVTSYYACQGFTFAKSNFPAKGEWVVIVKVTAPEGEGTARGSLMVN